MLTACQYPIAIIEPTASTCEEPGSVASDSFVISATSNSQSFVIYLPPCYDSTRLNYPAIYLLPGAGGNEETWFVAGAGTAADTAIVDGDAPPFIIITADNTGLEPNPDYIVTDLIPYVESHYRVQSDRAHRAIGGGSLGGMAAYRLGLRFADQFASIGIFGSGVVKGDEAQLKTWLTRLPVENKPRIFLNCGTQDTYMLERTRATISILDEAGIESKAVVSEGGHNYAYWVSNFPIYFEWVSQDW